MTLQLQLHHIDKRLSKGVKYKPNPNSEILDSIYEDISHTGLNYFDAVEAGCEKAILLDNAWLEMDLQMVIPDDGSYLLGNGKLLDYPVDDVYLSEVKPILHPLTNLTNEIFHNGERFVPIEKIGSQFDCFEIQLIAGNIPTSQRIEISKVSYEVYDWLLSHHFDVDNLIEKGLAVCVNDLKDNPYE